MKKKVGIGLFGKGALNHLHRVEMVESLLSRGIEVTFLTNPSFIDVIPKFDQCTYVPCVVCDNSKIKQYLVDNCRMLRWLYPSTDIAKRIRLFRGVFPSASLLGKVSLLAFFLLALFRPFMKLVLALETSLLADVRVDADIDLLILSGIGCRPPDGVQEVSKWARNSSIEIVYVATNYDFLSTRGFRGVDVEHVMVWGDHMVNDALTIHGIPRERIHIVGPVRYDCIEAVKNTNEADFFEKRRLSKHKKTIFFAGTTYPFHYVEMLSIYEKLLEDRDDIQLVLRVYPNKFFRDSPYLPVIENYAEKLNVYVSHGDVFKKNIYPGNQDVLWIEENELFYFLKNSSVVINIFSTLAIESLIFDKPTIYMNYAETFFQRNILKQAKLMPFDIRPPIKRLISYKAIDIANNREDMIRFIGENLSDTPPSRPQRKALVDAECGILDGKAGDRVAAYCDKVFSDRSVG